jgi:hypothetical protein
LARSLERALRGVGRPTLSVAEARERYAAHRGRNGFAAIPAPLLTAPDGNYKLGKSSVPTYGLALLQADGSGWEVCPARTRACTAHCVSKAGKGSFDGVQRARRCKTLFLAEDPEAFLVLLEDEIRRAVARHGRILCRLNTFSDVRWERVAPWLFDLVGVEFYDYTKWSPDKRVTPANYRLTFSASERTTDVQVAEWAAEGRPVAVVFDTARTRALPEEWAGVRVIDGDKTDDRTKDQGVIVGLRAKGSMRGDLGNGMVRRTA